MGVNFGGDVIPMPTYQFWYEYLITIFCCVQGVFFIAFTTRLIYQGGKSRIHFLFRTLFVVTCITSIAQSSHFLTPGHPFLHWLGGTSFSLLLMMLALCGLQILKSFTAMTQFVTAKKIQGMQLFFLAWGLLGFFINCGGLAFMFGGAPEWYVTPHQIIYQGFVLCVVVYETWHVGFTSHLILKNSASKKDRNAPSMITQNQLVEQTMIVNTKDSSATGLICYLAFMLSFLWFAVGIWVYSYGYPVNASPGETAIRILANHLGLWYSVEIYYFLQLLKKVQFREQILLSSANQIKNGKKLVSANAIKGLSERAERAELEPTRIITAH